MNNESVLNLLLLYFVIVTVFIVNEMKDCSKGLFKLFQNDLIFGNKETVHRRERHALYLSLMS